MTVKPIIFSGPMIRALLDGRKTQTRRVLKSPRDGSGWYRHPETGAIINSMGGPLPTVPYAPGALLWVRETWRTPLLPGGVPAIEFRADGTWVDWYQFMNRLPHPSCAHDDWRAPNLRRWRPSIHMPRWASRLTLEVTGVRVERLQDISEEDARAEGIECRSVKCADGQERELWFGVPHAGSERPTDAFADLWDSINNPRGYCAEDAPHSWCANPWVVAVSFRVHHANVGTVLEREAVNV